jgi:hypothetical protein
LVEIVVYFINFRGVVLHMEDYIQNIAVGAVAVVGAINAVMHVITSSKVGLPAKS